MRNAGVGTRRGSLRGNVIRMTALTAALLVVYGAAYSTPYPTVIVTGTQDIGAGPYSGVTVNSGGVAIGTGTTVTGSLYDLNLVNAGGSLTLTNATITNTIFPSGGPNGRAVTVTGLNANATLNNSTIVLDGSNGPSGGHAFTAGVGAVDGGHATIAGGTITATGSKRTVGIQANDGGTIDASGVTINTYSSFGHAVNAYRTVALPESATTVNLNNVKINTYDLTYADGIQSANKGASVNAVNTDITTVGTNSFGAEVFNGATASLTGGSITTGGATAAGVRVYGGSLGNGSVTVNGTHVNTAGAGAAGILAADTVERTSGTVNLTNANIETHGANAAAVQSSYGSRITSGGGNTFHTYGVNSTGVAALAGGGVSLGGDTVIAELGNGISSDGAGSTITTNGTTILTNGGGYGAYATNGGSINLAGGSVTNASTGAGSMGIAAVGAGSTITGTNVALSAKGEYINSGALSNVVSVSNGANISLTGGSISSLSSQFGRGILASTGASTVSTNGTAISTVGRKSIAVQAYGASSGGAPEISVANSTLSTRGDESYGLYAFRNGKVTSAGMAITTAGAAGFGAFAEDGGQAILDGGSIVTTGAALPVTGGQVGSFGVLSKNGSIARLSNLSVTTSGDYANGVRAENGTLTATNVSVSTTGANAAGVWANNGSNVTVNGGSVAATGSNSSGVYLEDSGTVNLAGVTVKSSGASVTSQLTQAGRTQNITAGSGTTMTQNNGTLLQVNRAAAGMDGIVNLTLAAGSTSTGDIVDLDGLTVGGSGTRALGGKTNFTVATGASWMGIVKGINDTTAADNTSATFHDATPIAGNVSGGSNSTITFTNGANIGGGVSTGAGTQGSFTGPTTIGGNVAGSGSTLAFNGPTNIGQNLSTQGSSVTFGTTANIAQSVNTGTGSTVAFNGPATIGQHVTGGTGSNISFAGTTTISQSVSGSGATFQFSKGQPTTIGGDVVLSDNSTLKGGTVGTPIQIQGAATVNSGSTLGGNLLVTGPLGGSGGTLSPGNSVGTQSYATSAGFTGAYKAEVNAAGNSDLIIIRSGNLDLSGIDLAVAQENGTGGYVLQHKYTIIQTPGGQVQNTFKSTALDASFANTLVKLDPVAYGAQDVRVSLSVDPAKVANKRLGLSANQNATLDGTISVAGLNASAAAALASTDTKGVLNQLSGEVHGSTQSALLSSGGQLVRTLSNRMRANLGAPMMAGAPVAQASGSMPAGAMPQSTAYPLWAQVVGDWRTFKGNDNTAKSSLATGGLFVGGDTDVGAGWRVGGALGFTNGRVDVNDRSSKSDLKSYTASLYGGKSWATAKGQINFLAGAGYTRYTVDSRRSVTVGGAQTLEANYHANATQLFTELGYAIPVGQASTIEPYVGLAWINLRSQGFDETGGPAALHGDSRTDSVSTMTLGLRGKTMVNVGRQTATLTAGLGWRLAGGDVNPERRLAFVQGNGAAFNVAGAPIARNSAVLDLGAEMAVGKNAALGLAYSGQFGAGNRDNTGSLYVKVRF